LGGGGHVEPGVPGRGAWGAGPWSLEEIHKPGELLRQCLPPVEVGGNGRTLSPGGRLQCRAAGVGNLNPKLAPILRVSRPRDQPRVLEPGKDAAERLALDMNSCGELFLVHRAGCHGFQRDDGGTRQPQWRQGIVVEALH